MEIRASGRWRSRSSRYSGGPVWSSAPSQMWTGAVTSPSCEPPGVAEDPVVLQASRRALAHRLLDESDRVHHGPRSPQRGRRRQRERRGGSRGRGVSPRRRRSRRAERAEASQGARRTRKSRIRSSLERPLVVPKSSKGTALESSPTAVTRSAHLGCADRSVRPTARPTHDGESVDAEGAVNAVDVGRPVEQAAPRLVRRPAHARTIRGDDAHAQCERGGMGRRGIEPGAQAPVKAQDGQPIGIPVLLEGELPPVGQRDRSGHVGCIPSTARADRRAGSSREEVRARRHAIGCCCAHERG